jgi:DNA polymerase elongation subunit (family B)
MNKEQHSLEQIVKAVKGTAGIKTAIAKKLGVHRHTIDRYENKYPRVRQAIQNDLNRVLDKAESNLFVKIMEGNIDISKWFLSRKGKTRGYTGRTELSDKESEEIKIVFRSANYGEDE